MNPRTTVSVNTLLPCAVDILQIGIGMNNYIGQVPWGITLPNDFIKYHPP